LCGYTPIEPLKRVLGLDIGTRRIGVAMSDGLGLTAQPLETVAVAADGGHIRRIADLCEAHGVSTLVAGIPYEFSGREGLMARKVRRILAEISSATGHPIHEVDERLTSRQAERTLVEADVRRHKRREIIDQLAAALILQSWLDARRSEG
jgi:putative Holliday junction resolvase